MFTVYKKYLPFFKSANEIVQKSHVRFYAQFLRIEFKNSRTIITATDGFQVKQFSFAGHDDWELKFETYLNKGQVDALVKGKADFTVDADKISQSGTDYKTPQKFSFPNTDGIWPEHPESLGVLVNQAFIGDPFPKTKNGVRLWHSHEFVEVKALIDGVECKQLFCTMKGHEENE